MTKPKNQKNVEKIYMVVSGEENKFFYSFSEAETCAKDLCEENDEEIQIFEINKAWNVFLPAEPEPEAMVTSLVSLVD